MIPLRPIAPTLQRGGMFLVTSPITPEPPHHLAARLRHIGGRMFTPDTGYVNRR